VIKLDPNKNKIKDPITFLDLRVEENVIKALVNKDKEKVIELVRVLHSADAADLLEHISDDERKQLIEFIGAEFNPKILTELDKAILHQVVNCLGIENIALALKDLNSDDVLEVIEELDELRKKQLLDSMPPLDRSNIEEGLSYPRDSAGRLMQREVASVPSIWKVGKTIDFLRSNEDQKAKLGCNLPDQFYDLFVIDSKHKPIGAISLSRMLRVGRDTAVTDIMDTNMKILPVNLDQEDVAFIFRQRDLVSAPVVDNSGRLVGAITIDDVVDVIHEELEEDFLRLGGVQEGDLFDATLATTKARFSWLLVNLGTAIVVSLVIGLFDATLDQMVALAVLMPIVASMGGNAGTQTLTVAIRALAMKELTPTNTARIIGKEALIGVFNGILFAILIGLVTCFWFSNLALGIVIGLAMIVNMFVAGLAGTTIPITLNRIGIDPAVASSVVLTTITDVVGFFVFLGLAAILLF
jgi:magnesium transporter